PDIANESLRHHTRQSGRERNDDKDEHQRQRNEYDSDGYEHARRTTNGHDDLLLPGPGERAGSALLPNSLAIDGHVGAIPADVKLFPASCERDSSQDELFL